MRSHDITHTVSAKDSDTNRASLCGSGDVGRNNTQTEWDIGGVCGKKGQANEFDNLVNVIEGIDQNNTDNCDCHVQYHRHNARRWDVCANGRCDDEEN